MECLVDFEEYVSQLAESVELKHGTSGSSISYYSMPLLLDMLRDRLKSEDAYARFEFDYFIEKRAPVTDKAAPMGYRCAFTGVKKNGEYKFTLEVNVTAASLCPCSREMSLLKNVVGAAVDLRDANITEIYVEGQDKFGNFTNEDATDLISKVGMGAHNQRSQIQVELIPKDDTIVWIEDVVLLAEAQASAPTYPILKRPDEKWVTERAYGNAKFSEDIARDLQIALEADSRIAEWAIRVTNEESIHPYNVQTIQRSANWHH
jgi:GTP cyclohydrolase I